MRCTYAARMIAGRLCFAARSVVFIRIMYRNELVSLIRQGKKFKFCWWIEFVELPHRASFLSAFHSSGSSPAILNQCIFYTFTCDMPFHAGQALYQGRSRNCPSWAGGCFPWSTSCCIRCVAPLTQTHLHSPIPSSSYWNPVEKI